MPWRDRKPAEERNPSLVWPRESGDNASSFQHGGLSIGRGKFADHKLVGEHAAGMEATLRCMKPARAFPDEARGLYRDELEIGFELYSLLG